MIKEVIHKIKSKQKHYLSFKKAVFNITEASEYDYQYRVVNDTYVLSKAHEAAAAHNCSILTYREHNWKTEGRILEVTGTKKDYIEFCIAFGEKMNNYIKDIEF